MIHTVYSNKGIDWNARGVNKILQNITNILNTFMYEVAYDRVMGRDPANIDKPLDQLIPSVIEETYELIEEYEPRAEIIDVQVITQNDEPVIKVVVNID